MKFLYIESWCKEVEISEEELETMGLAGKSAEEVSDWLNGDGTYDEDTPHPKMFDIKKGNIIWPADGVEIYNTEWRER